MDGLTSEPRTDLRYFQSREELVRYLEQVSGRTFRTREDIRKYLEEISNRKVDDNPVVRDWRMFKNGALLLLLVLGSLQYYFFDVLNQVASLHSVTIFLPVTTPLLKSNLALLSVFV